MKLCTFDRSPKNEVMYGNQTTGADNPSVGGVLMRVEIESIMLSTPYPRQCMRCHWINGLYACSFLLQHTSRTKWHAWSNYTWRQRHLQCPQVMNS